MSVVPSPEPPKPQVPKLTAPQVSEAPKQPEQTMETPSVHTGQPAELSRSVQSPISSEQRRRVIHGVGIIDEQWDTLQSGGHIFVENMEHPTVGKLFLDDEKKRVFYSPDDPDAFVKYGHYEMRLRDKMLVE